MYIILTATWWRHALQPRSCLPFCPDSVCLELTRRHTVWKWHDTARIRVFRGGLQAKLLQAEIGLRSFITWFSYATHEVAWENSFALWKVRHSVIGLWAYETSPREVTGRKRLCSHLRWSAEKHFEDWQKEKLPSQKKLIKGKTVGTSLCSKKMYRFWVLGKEKPENAQCVLANA